MKISPINWTSFSIITPVKDLGLAVRFLKNVRKEQSRLNSN